MNGIEHTSIGEVLVDSVKVLPARFKPTRSGSRMCHGCGRGYSMSLNFCVPCRIFSEFKEDVWWGITERGNLISQKEPFTIEKLMTLRFVGKGAPDLGEPFGHFAAKVLRDDFPENIIEIVPPSVLRHQYGLMTDSRTIENLRGEIEWYLIDYEEGEDLKTEEEMKEERDNILMRWFKQGYGWAVSPFINPSKKKVTEEMRKNSNIEWLLEAYLPEPTDLDE